MKGKLELKNMIFFAHHGCFKEERVIGNQFVVDFSVELEVGKAAESDDIEDALNYQSVFNIINEEMSTPSHLLEHLASRTLKRIKSTFADTGVMTISIAKINPPLGGQVGASRITLSL